MSYRSTNRYLAVLLLVVVASTTLLASSAAAQESRAPGGVEVTPDHGTGSEAANGSYVRTFWVKNTRTVSSTYTLSCSGTGAITCTGMDVEEVTLSPNQTTDVAAWFNTGSAGSGALWVHAAGPAFDDGNVNYDVVAVGPPGVAERNANADNRDRTQCLTTGAGEAAAWQCGDLLVSHSTPAYTTLGKDRSLSFLYNSATAHPTPVVTAVVTQYSSQATPSTVYAVLRVNTGSGLVTVASSYFSTWSSGTRQIALAWDAVAVNNGRYPYTLEVQNQYPSGNYGTTVSGYIVVANRHNYSMLHRLGKGWSIAGMEQVFTVDSNRVLWLGADGSTRLYSPVSGWGLWTGAAGGFRDTLEWNGGTQRYVRSLRHGVKVQYNTHGYHSETINRLGQTTRFHWDTINFRLDSIVVPPDSAKRRTYRFTYSGTYLDKVTDPAGRITDFTHSSGTVTSITDPVTSLVTSFTYDGGARMTSRTSARGPKTRYEYANAIHLTKVHAPYGAGTPIDTARTELVPWDERGLGQSTGGPYAAVDTANAFSVIRGARYPAIPDTARFYIDKWGAPVKTINALGHTTTIVKGDGTVPALATRITYPNTRVVKMTWDARGNLLTQMDSSIHLDGRGNATTTWAYSSANTKDSPSLVTDPMGRSTVYTYTALGLTDSVIDARGHVTKFTYAGSDVFESNGFRQIPGLLLSVTERSVQTWRESDSSVVTMDQTSSMRYDSLGNVRTSTSPVGAITTYVRDTLSRVTATYDPLGTKTGYVYDAMNRTLKMAQYTAAYSHPFGVSPLGGCVSTQVVCTDQTKSFNPVLPDSLISSYRHAAAGLDTIADPRDVKRKYAYDAAGAMYRETDEHSLSRYGYFGPTGLMDSTLSRDGVTVKFVYDTLGRRTRLIYPPRDNHWMGDGDTTPILGDTVRYTYDMMGNMLTATNRRGEIRRTYYANGLLKKQVTLRNTLDPDSLEYEYNLAGQITRKLHGNADTVDYTYKASGDLDSMIVRWKGSGANRRRAFGFEWDALGRRMKVRYPPTKVLEVTLHYDALGILRRLKSSNAHDNIANDRFDTQLRNRRVDAVGRILETRLDCVYSDINNIEGLPCGQQIMKADTNDYNRLGMLVRQATSGNIVDTMRYDASGNMISRYRWVNALKERRAYTIQNGSNRLHWDTLIAASGPKVTHTYSNEGSLLLQDPAVRNEANAALARYHYYDGLNRLTGTRYGTWGGNGFDLHDNPDTCEYNALGQLARPCDNGAPYLAMDGDNAYQTIFNSGMSGWTWFHGPGLDDPLIGRYRMPGDSLRDLYYVTDGNGRQLAVADSAGSLQTDDVQGNGKSDHRFAGGTRNSATFYADRFAVGDIPGVSFFRNRMYDTRTGRWTQEDPLGVAGGVNLYQFNGNNPVAFTDPFGLSPEGSSAECIPICLALAPAALKTLAVVGSAIIVTAAAIDISNKLERAGDPTGESGGDREGKDFKPKDKDQIRGPEGNSCTYCNRPTTRKPGPDQSQGDHVIPKSKGGSGSTGNGANACRTCNLDKGARRPDQWEPRWYDPK